MRVYEDFILCALHHTMHEVGEDQDEAGIGLELLAGWLSIATMHGNGYLQGLLEYAKDELLHRKGWADRRTDQLQQVEHENLGNDRIRLEMGKARRAREEHAAPPERGEAESPAGAGSDAGGYPRSVLGEVNRHLSEASVLLQESHRLTDAEEEAPREALHALVGAGLIISKLLQRESGPRVATRQRAARAAAPPPDHLQPGTLGPGYPSFAGVSRPASFGGEMDSEKIRRRLEQKIGQINAKLESTRNPARRKKLREKKWALKSRLRGN